MKIALVLVSEKDTLYCTPDTINRNIHESEIQKMRKIISKHMPIINGPLIDTTTCMYTTISDGHFIIDWYPNNNKNVLLCSPCSGHGFKFVSIVGEIVKDLVQTGESKTHDITLFSLYNRDAGTSV